MSNKLLTTTAKDSCNADTGLQAMRRIFHAYKSWEEHGVGNTEHPATDTETVRAQGTAHEAPHIEAMRANHHIHFAKAPTKPGGR